MGTYLDRLNEQFDTITTGIDEILDRAATENREVTDKEQELVEREQAKAEQLKASIDHYAGIEATRAKVAETRSKLPTTVQRSTTSTSGGSTVVVVERDPSAQLKAMFPSVGDYIVTVGRALRGDHDAGELINRAQDLYRETVVDRATTTQHQTTADNPGLIPRPILGPVVNLIDGQRPFINAIAKKPLPAGDFDRPTITQHVAIGKQSAEKAPTESQKMVIGKLPVSADTYAGHVNVSRQDIKWSSPGIMQILAEDFAVVYAVETEQDAEAQFLTSIAGNTPVTVPTFDAAAIRAALFAAAAAPVTAGKPLGRPDALFMSLDVWGALGGLLSPTGVPAFPGLTPGNPDGGDVAGFNGVVGPYWPAGTAVLGPSKQLEWYEDIDGLIQVAEPDVLGQLVGYAGFGAFLNVDPTVFTTLELPPPVPLDAPAKSSSKS